MMRSALRKSPSVPTRVSSTLSPSRLVRPVLSRALLPRETETTLIIARLYARLAFAKANMSVNAAAVEVGGDGEKSHVEQDVEHEKHSADRVPRRQRVDILRDAVEAALAP